MRPKVLLVGHLPPARGGIAAFLHTVLHSPLASHYTLATFDIRRPTKARVFHNYGYRAVWNAGLWRALVAVLVTLWHLVSFPAALLWQRPAVVHVHSAPFLMFWETAYYALVARLFRYPVVFQFHSWFRYFYRQSRPRTRAVILWVLRHMTRFFVICQADARLIRTVDDGRIDCRYVPNFLDVRQFRRQLARVDIRPDEQSPVVLFVGGNDAAHKGLHDVLRAVRELDSSTPGHFIFTAVPRETVEQHLRPAPRSSYEIFDWVSGPTKATLFARADVFVLPSYAEGMPMAIIEAMASEAAVVATRVGGIPDLITDGQEGYLVNAGDTVGLAAALSSLLTDPATRAAMGRRGLDKALRCYDTRVGARQLHELYTELLNARHATLTMPRPDSLDRKLEINRL